MRTFQGSVVRVEQQHTEGCELRGPVPAVGAVHQARLLEKGNVMDD